MRIRKYWARTESNDGGPNKSWHLVAFGSSNDNIADACRDAELRLQRMRLTLADGTPPDHYAYTDRPLREELKRDIQHGGRRVAVITRNSYGALILNTIGVMFIDIDNVDLPKPGGFLRSIRGFFGGTDVDPHHVIKQRIGAALQRHAGLELRLYQTARGYRCLVTNCLWDPTSDASRRVLKAFGSDRLYVKLCAAQECYRARLTPKPWRIDIARPTHRFPWANRDCEQEYRQWEERYEQRCADTSVCRYLCTFGDSKPIAEVAEIIRIHDSFTLGTGELA